jgi:hypothetical protein
MAQELNESVGDRKSPLSPLDPFPERVTNVYEAKDAANPTRRGPMRFEEGIASDTDVPNDFIVGVRSGYQTGARPNQNAIVWEKPPDETMKERAHVGSAAWVEAPDYLQAFAGGTGPEAERAFVQVTRDGAKYHRQDAAVVRD